MTRRASTLRAFVPGVLAASDHSRHRWSDEGTLGFFDLSGFTRLSERLATLGRLGAEEVTAAVDACFTGLIDIVFEHDGDVLSFGGDALFTWFGGDDHAVRAARAAVAMQRWIGRNGRTETSKGVVRLRMSSGLAAGRVDFLLAGRSSRELLVLGPTVDAALAAEARSSSGRVGLAEGFDARVEPTWTMRTNGRLELRLRAVPAVGGVPRSPTIVPTGDLEAFVLPGLRAEVVGEERSGEHRSATVAFVRVRSDSGTLAPDEAYELIEQVCQRSGVHVLATDADIGGYKVILAAGVPDGITRRRERVVAAAHEICNGVQCSAGVAHGVVFAGDVGHPQRRTWTVMGDTVNTAARLASAAPLGAATIHRSVAEQLDDRFELGPVRTFMVKGKASAIDAHDVVAVVTASPRPAEQLPLLGREADVRVVLDGGEHAVEVVGEPGIGRTRFLAEIAQRVDTSIWCQGTPSRQHHPWSAIGPVVEWVRDRRHLLDDTDQAMLDRVASRQPMPPDLDMSGVVPRIVVALVAGLRSPNDTVWLLVDDLAWCDAPSLEVFDGLAATEGDHRLVVTRRPAEPSLAVEARIVTLPRLDDHTIESIALAATTRSLSDHDLGEIVSLAAGVPQNAVALSMHVGGELPGSIEELRSAAFDRLRRDDRRRLRLAAVAGTEVDTGLLAEVTSDSSWSDPATLEALGAFVVETPRGWQFRHEADRQAALLGMSVRDRRQLHCDLAAALIRRGSESIVIAEHAIAASDSELCASHAPLAGREAAHRAAWHDAARFYIAAAEATEDSIVAGNHWMHAAAAAEQCGLPDDAERALREAIRSAPDPLTAAELWRRRSMIARRADRFSLSLRWSAMGIRAIGDVVAEHATDDATDAGVAERVASVEVALLLERAATLTFQERLVDAAAATADAARIVERRGSPSDRAQLLIQQEMLASASGDDAAAETAASEALALLDGTNHRLDRATLLLNRGAARGEAGDWPGAVERLQRAQVEFEAIGHVAGEVIARMNLCGLLVEQGRLDEADVGLRRIRRVAAACGLHDVAGFADATLGRVAAWEGDWESVDRLLIEPLGRFPADGDRSLLVWATLFGAEAALLHDDVATAQQVLGGLEPLWLEQLPSAAAAFRRFTIGTTGNTADELWAALEVAREHSIGIEVIQLARTIRATGGGDGDLDTEVAQWMKTLGIIVPPPIPPGASVGIRAAAATMHRS